MSETNRQERGSAYENHVLGSQEYKSEVEDGLWPPKVDTVSVDLGAEGRAIAAFLEILEELPAHSQHRVMVAVNNLVAPIATNEDDVQVNLRRLRETFGDGE